MRVTRNSVTEPTSRGRFAHRIWAIINRLRKPDGSVDRHNCFLNAAARGGDQPGHSHGAQWSRWNRFHGMKGGGAGVKWGGPLFPAPSFLRLPGGVGVTLCARPPEARPSRRMARGVPKGPNRRFDRRSYRLQRRRGGGRPGGRRELFPFRNPAPTLQKSEVIGVAGLGNPAQTAWPHSCFRRPLSILALRTLK